MLTASPATASASAARPATRSMRARRAGRRPRAGEAARRTGDERRAGETTSAKIQPSCARTDRGCAVARDSRQRERDAEHRGAERRRRARHATRLSTRLRSSRTHAAAARHASATPKREYVSSSVTVRPYSSTTPSIAAARGEPQRERHAGGAEERELVPVVERRAQTRKPAVVAVERRHALREQRPADEQAEQRSSALRRCARASVRAPTSTPSSANAA